METDLNLRIHASRIKFRSLGGADIFCYGPILEAVQKAELYNDSKDFVDMPMRHSPEKTLAAFEQIRSMADDKDILRQFVEENFEPIVDQLQVADLSDWSPMPKLLAQVEDSAYQTFATSLNGIWFKLGRKVNEVVKLQPDRFSLIYVPHPFVIPGGRFREIYCWDSYWIAKGLLACGMTETVKGMILNLAYLVEKFGMIPNGSRIYYLNRSQPPVFIPMVKDYYEATADLQLITEVLPTLEKEFLFWTQNRQFTLELPNKPPVNYFRYKVTSYFPRPESWREDTHTASEADDLAAKQQIWSEIAAAAESGWDFSSRWLGESCELKSCRTSAIIPVDLNTFMAFSAKSLQQLFTIAGDDEKAEEYNQHYKTIRAAIRQIHWNDLDGIWYDYDLEENCHRRQFYISNVTPLIAGCHKNVAEAKRVYQYLQKCEAITKYPHGIPTSFVNSHQQWDYRNAWAPTVHLLIEGLRLTGDSELCEAAERIASQWVRINFEGFIKTTAMYEKYDVSDSTHFGGIGGEYIVQTGFGWTNGVVLDLLARYPQMKYCEESDEQDQMVDSSNMNLPPIPPPSKLFVRQQSEVRRKFSCEKMPFRRQLSEMSTQRRVEMTFGGLMRQASEMGDVAELPKRSKTFGPKTSPKIARPVLKRQVSVNVSELARRK